MWCGQKIKTKLKKKYCPVCIFLHYLFSFFWKSWKPRELVQGRNMRLEIARIWWAVLGSGMWFPGKMCLFCGPTSSQYLMLFSFLFHYSKNIDEVATTWWATVLIPGDRHGLTSCFCLLVLMIKRRITKHSNIYRIATLMIRSSHKRESFRS